VVRFLAAPCIVFVIIVHDSFEVARHRVIADTANTTSKTTLLFSSVFFSENRNVGVHLSKVYSYILY